MRTLPTLASALALFLSIAPVADAQWSTSRSDNHRSSRSLIRSSQSDDLVYPITDLADREAIEVVEGASGRVYFSRTRDLLSVDPATGAMLWTALFSTSINTSGPAIGPAETLHVTRLTAGMPGPGSVVKLDSGGNVLWTWPITATIQYVSRLAVDDAGNVYGRYQGAPYVDWTAFKLDPSGTLVWSQLVALQGGFNDGAPAIGADGAIYFSGHLDGITRLDGTTGNVDWASDPGGALSTPVIADNGLVLVHAGGNAPVSGVHAFAPATGSSAWTFPYGASSSLQRNAPALLSNGDIVAIDNGVAGRTVFRISPTDGSIVGSVPSPIVAHDTETVVGGDDTIYIWNAMRLAAFSAISGSMKFEFNPAATAGCVISETVTPLADGSIFATWMRKQTCENATGINQYATLAAPTDTPPDCTGNVGPVAVIADPDSLLWPGTSITLDGTGSFDPDVGIAYYEWREIINGPGPVLSFDPTYTFTTGGGGLSPLVLQFQLRVTDGCDLFDVDTLAVTVLPVGTIVAPTSADVWEVDTARSIVWLPGTSPTTRVIQIARDGGAWEDIVVPTPNDGEYTWSVTGPPTTNAVVRIFPAGNLFFAQMSEPFTIASGATDIAEIVAPTRTRLVRAWPNPVRGDGLLAIDFELAGAAPASIRIYDVRGNLIRTLLDAERPQGPGRVFWDGRSQSGHAVAGGIYFYRFESGAIRDSRKISWVR